MNNIEHDLFGENIKSSINSKKKGDRNELTCAKVLSDWVGVPFSRVPSSGGLRWSNDQSIIGDVIAPSNIDFPFTVETKHYKKIPLKQQLNKRSCVYKFMEQCLSDCKRLYEQTGQKNYPMLMLRENNMTKNQYYFVTLPILFTPISLLPITSGEFFSQTFLINVKITVYLYSELVDNVSFGDFNKHLPKNDWDKIYTPQENDNN